MYVFLSNRPKRHTNQVTGTWFHVIVCKSKAEINSSSMPGAKSPKWIASNVKKTFVGFCGMMLSESEPQTHPNRIIFGYGSWHGPWLSPLKMNRIDYFKEVNLPR